MYIIQLVSDIFLAGSLQRIYSVRIISYKKAESIILIGPEKQHNSNGNINVSMEVHKYEN